MSLQERTSLPVGIPGASIFLNGLLVGDCVGSDSALARAGGAVDHFSDIWSPFVPRYFVL